MNKETVLETLIKLHPDIFVILLLRHNSRSKILEEKFPIIFQGWDDFFMEKRPVFQNEEENYKYKLPNESNQNSEEILSFISKHKYCMDWSEFRRKSMVIWDKVVVDKFF